MGLLTCQEPNMEYIDGYEEKTQIQNIYEVDKIVPDESVVVELYSEKHENISNDFESHEKWTCPHNMDIDQKNCKKRRGSNSNANKKPGRKPITSEPTSKRKAQNRAAQRAFRDRRDKYLRGLEVKVLNLEIASESANNENSILRAQINKILEELEEHRKRLFFPGNEYLSSLSNNYSMCHSSHGVKSCNYHNSSESKFGFDIPRFSWPQGQDIAMNELKNTSLACEEKPTCHSQNQQQSNSNRSLFVKSLQKDLAQTECQANETEISSLPNHFIVQIPNNGNYDNSEFDVISGNRSDSMINTEIPNRLSPRMDFISNNISFEHRAIHNSPFDPGNDETDLVI
ncbi:AP-1-like transcription factor napA [Erysiphe necator]|nr:AP-1-like transcription factor napA [Erysiphe necator]